MPTNMIKQPPPGPPTPHNSAPTVIWILVIGLILSFATQWWGWLVFAAVFAIFAL